MQELGPYLVSIFRSHGYILVFLGAIFFGEAVVLASAFLAYLGFFEFHWVIVCLLLGTTISDHFWYWFGYWSKKVVGNSSRFVPFFGNRVDNFKERFQTEYGKFLIFTKFIYGIRILILTLAGRKKIDYQQFTKYNFIGTIIWLAFLILIGYTMGFSWHRLENYSFHTKYLVFVGLALIVVVRFFLTRTLKFFGYEQRN